MQVKKRRHAWLCCLCFLAMLLPALTPAISSAYSDDRYAALIIDANSGRVLHAENSKETRYPASLTKMMTLYMTFDALRTGRLKLTDSLTASKKAAGMPSTNLSLKPGDKITVRDAIKALVVRSANDVAVILAENLAGSEYRFASLMTATAHRLGMKQTTFRNASGLPDRQQHTTARDLAVLALALRRHYPQYYDYFNTRSFNYKGRTYTTHNRVLNRITGADGLKTGYIRASGFNLVTSVSRRNGALIGVVMGGDSARERDDRMVNLMERSFALLNTRGGDRQFVSLDWSPNGAESALKETKEKPKTVKLAVAEDKPLPAQKPQELRQLTQTASYAGEVAIGEGDIDGDAPMKSNPSIFAVAFNPQSTAQPYFAVKLEGENTAPTVATQQFNPPQATSSGAAPQVSTARDPFVPASYSETPAPRAAGTVWGVQVGAYEEQREAMVAASEAVGRLPELLRRARVHVADTQKVSDKVLYRARVANLSQSQAREACRQLQAVGTACFVYQTTAGNI